MNESISNIMTLMCFYIKRAVPYLNQTLILTNSIE